MPFAKWNVEPVCLGRGSTPWSAQNTHTNGNVHKNGLDNHTQPSDGSSDNSNSSTDNSSSILLSPYSVILEPLLPVINGSGANNECDSQGSAENDGSPDPILANIQTRVLIGAIRQMGALAVAADQLFAELTDECRRVCERTVSLRTRTDRLSANVDRANLTMKRTVPQVGNLIAEFARLPTAEHWQSRQFAQYNLFTPDTRPWSIQDVYARAHAPGDVRLSRGFAANGVAHANGSDGHTLGYPSPFVTIMRNSRRGRNSNITSSRACARSSHPPDCRCSCHSGSSASPSKSVYHPHHTIGHVNRKRNSSSPSSVVTWSSLASSSVFAPSDLYSKTTSAQQRPTGPRRSQTIDDFFREHNVSHNHNGRDRFQDLSPRADSRLHNGDCDQCDCQEAENDTSGLLSRQESVSTQRSSMNDCTQQHWGWMMSDDEHRRWSSAMAAPLKPANLDELSIWLRENIETRKPENIVFKSVSDLGDAELEQKLRPVHTLSLLSRPDTEVETEESEVEDSRRSSRLKRRWSLLIPKLRRRSQQANESRGESQSPARNSEPFFSRLTRNRQSLPPESRIARSDIPSTSQPKSAKAPSDKISSSSEDQNDTAPVREVYLITPGERAALLASLYAAPQFVDINVTGRNFDRLSSTRRSLIHSDFHVPRHRIHGYSRSRSPHRNKTLQNRTSTPKTPVAERGCQTEDFGGRQNYPNRTQVAVEVHQNPASDSLRNLSSSSSTLDRAQSLPRSSIVRSAIIQTAQNKQKVFQKKKSNNYRSSSGNWSAATSDFLGSSTSSSPLHVPRARVRRQNSNETTTNGGQPPHATEEVESVYSCDNDGYYTSMHTDSLLFSYSGSTAPVRSRSHGLAQQFRRAFEEIKEESSNAGSKSNLLGSKEIYGSNVSINSILSQSTDAAVVDDHRNEFDCSVSHCSHQFENHDPQMFYSKPKVETLHEEEGSDSTLCSNSHTNKSVKKSSSLRNPLNKENKRRHADLLTRSATTLDPHTKNQTLQKNNANSSSSRTLLGRHSSLTESSSASSLCRRMPPPPPPPRVSSMLSTLKQFQDDNRSSEQRGSPTDDDLDTVSMSLVSESRHDNRCDSVASSLIETGSQYSYSGRPTNNENVNSARQNQQSVAESETNSEYLRNANERRQRLFLNVDSARSYPPLSYDVASYEHAEVDPETATLVSVSSSVCFDDDDAERPNTNCSTVSSSQTLTPENKLDEESSKEDELDIETSSVATLERRHLSSPTPAPKLDSVVNMRQKSDTPKTPPTPAPRNSLHISVDEEENIGPLGSFSTTTTPVTKLTSPLSLKEKSVSADNSPALSTNRRQFTAQDLYAIVHNQKRKHNIKASPTIYSTASLARSKTDDDAKLSSMSTQLSGTLPRVQGPKRHSLAEPPQSPGKKDCSIAQRLGPLRPTTLHDFKKLLSQVRPSVPQTSAIQKVSPSSSTYSSLQQVLKSVGGDLETDAETPNSEMLTSTVSNCSTESGVYSMLSPSSEASGPTTKTSDEPTPTSVNTVTSPVRKRAFAAGLAPNRSIENQISNANSMNEFIRKFTKQKLTAVNGGVSSSGHGLSATARLEAATKSPCPPIPEDEQEPAFIDEEVECDPSSSWV